MVFPKKLHFFSLGPRLWAGAEAADEGGLRSSPGDGLCLCALPGRWRRQVHRRWLVISWMEHARFFLAKMGYHFFLVFPRFFHHHTLGECEKSRMKGGDITRIACLFPVPSDIGISGYLGWPLQEGWIWCFLRSLVVMQRATKVCGTSEAAILWV